MPHIHKYLAEAFGAFMLACIVGSSILAPGFSTPLAAGLTLGLLVYILGTISGTHINPEVTIAMWSIKKIPSKDAVFYVLAQLIGGFVALLKLQYEFGRAPAPVFASTPTVLDVGLSQFMGEMAGAFVLVLGVSAVVHRRVQDAAVGLVIGGALLLGIVVATPLSLGVLNPAVALGIGAFSWQYFVAPVIGALAAAWLYRYFDRNETLHAM